MRNRWQYILLAIGWLLAIVSLPLRGADLNGFLTWRGGTTTQGLIQWFFGLPRMVFREWSDPAVAGGIGPGGRVASTTFAFGDLLFLAAVLVGFILFLLSPFLVRRRANFSLASQTVIRCIAPIMLVLPASAFAPKAWALPLPGIGMWLLCAAHVAICAALMLTTSSELRTGSFPVTVTDAA